MGTAAGRVHGRSPARARTRAKEDTSNEVDIQGEVGDELQLEVEPEVDRKSSSPGADQHRDKASNDKDKNRSRTAYNKYVERLHAELIEYIVNLPEYKGVGTALEAFHLQRAQAEDDLLQWTTLRTRYLANPHAFLQDLKSGRFREITRGIVPQNIPLLPTFENSPYHALVAGACGPSGGRNGKVSRLAAGPLHQQFNTMVAPHFPTPMAVATAAVAHQGLPGLLSSAAANYALESDADGGNDNKAGVKQGEDVQSVQIAPTRQQYFHQLGNTEFNSMIGAAFQQNPSSTSVFAPHGSRNPLEKYETRLGPVYEASQVVAHQRWNSTSSTVSSAAASSNSNPSSIVIPDRNMVGSPLSQASPASSRPQSPLSAGVNPLLRRPSPQRAGIHLAKYSYENIGRSNSPQSPIRTGTSANDANVNGALGANANVNTNSNANGATSQQLDHQPVKKTRYIKPRVSGTFYINSTGSISANSQQSNGSKNGGSMTSPLGGTNGQGGGTGHSTLNPSPLHQGMQFGSGVGMQNGVKNKRKNANGNLSSGSSSVKKRLIDSVKSKDLNKTREFSKAIKNLNPNIESSDEFKELKKLQLIQESTMAMHVSDPVHHGFACDGCNVEPIVGTRYSCETCKSPPLNTEFDLCRDCYEKYDTIKGGSHDPRTHKFRSVETPQDTSIAGNGSGAGNDTKDEYSYLGL